MEHKPENGQAGVEVTPEMIEAGKAVVDHWMAETDDGSGPSLYCLGELVKDVFDAMSQRSPYSFMKVSKSRPICCIFSASLTNSEAVHSRSL